jgi:hypothetical protein
MDNDRMLEEIIKESVREGVNIKDAIRQINDLIIQIGNTRVAVALQTVIQVLTDMDTNAMGQLLTPELEKLAKADTAERETLRDLRFGEEALAIVDNDTRFQ